MIVLAARADLFRLLGDEDRLRLLALCAEEELTVGELATLLGESQPQVTKKTQPLREFGLLSARKDGTRTLLKTDVVEARSDKGRTQLPQPAGLTTKGRTQLPQPAVRNSDTDGLADALDPVIAAALEEGRALCAKDGSLARIPRVIAAREEVSRRLFDQPQDERPAPAVDPTLLSWLPLLAPLLPGRALAVDIGTGEGALLPLLSPLFDRVIAVDRSAARLARAASNIASWDLPNVRLREGAVDDAALAEEVYRFTRTDDPRGPRGADLVVMARVLVHASRPQDVIAQAAQLVRPGGHLILIDYVPHDDESLREQGHVWLGFEPGKLRTWLEAARLQTVAVQPFSQPLLQLAVGRKPGDHHGHS
ncbi:MAG TPA: methyltransferase [Kofleriaceae bacterium]|nr:methyltransferase [Kofleriaceae bacterium]